MKGIALLFVAIILCSCTTPAKTYRAPNDARVVATTKTLNEKVQKAVATASKARQSTKEAQASALRLVKLAKDVSEKLEILAARVPAELKPLVQDVRAAAQAQAAEEAIIRAKTELTFGHQANLEVQLNEAERARLAVIAAQDEYQLGAGEIARDATDESQRRFEAESQLLQQKLYRWLFRGLIGTVLLVGIAVVIAWKLGWKLLKI